MGTNSKSLQRKKDAEKNICFENVVSSYLSSYCKYIWAWTCTQTGFERKSLKALFCFLQSNEERIFYYYYWEWKMHEWIISKYPFK